jgi:hypothetical protein
VIRTVVAAVAATSALALAACASPTSSALPSATSNASGTWVQTSSGSVDLPQAVDAKAVLSGSATDAANKLSVGIATLKNDLAGLGAQEQLPANIADVNQSLAGFTNAQQVALQARYSSCSAFTADVSLVGDGVSAVGDSVSKGDDTVYVVTQAVATVRQDISAVQDLKSKLVAAGGQPDATVDALITQAEQDQSAAAVRVTSADQQMKALYQKANDLYDAVENAGNACLR